MYGRAYHFIWITKENSFIAELSIYIVLRMNISTRQAKHALSICWFILFLYHKISQFCDFLWFYLSLIKGEMFSSGIFPKGWSLTLVLVKRCVLFELHSCRDDNMIPCFLNPQNHPSKFRKDGLDSISTLSTGNGYCLVFR